MNNDKRRILFVTFLAFFSLIVLGAQFFHQEETLEQMDNCAICLWQMNTVALACLYFLVILVIFALFHYLRIFSNKIHFAPSFYHYSLRGPPSNQ